MMFISKKEYERNLRREYVRGRKEAISEMELGERLNCMGRNLYEGLDRVEKRLNHRINSVLKATEKVVNETKYNEVCEKCSY